MNRMFQALRRSSSPTATAGLACVVLLGATCPPPATAQEKVFEGSANVVEVQVPVNVTTRDGQPVRDLTADDFVVFDRGQKQKLSGFQMVDLQALQPKDGVARSEQVADLVPAVARRHFFLLFDLTFATPASIVKARRAAEKFVLNDLNPTDLAAVATFSMDVGPRLIVTFTPDRAQLARAIDTLGAPRLLDRKSSVDPLRFMIVDPDKATMSSTFNEATGPENALRPSGYEQEIQSYLNVIANEMEKSEKSFQRGRIATWMSALGDMAKMLGSVDGRKHVVLFSEGFDGRLMLGRGPDANDRKAQMDRLALQMGQHWMVDTDDIYGNTALQNYVTRMLEEFRRADCTIQAVDISGLGDDTSEARRAHTVGQDALFYLANETGGNLFEDANDLGSELEDMLTRSSVTYILSFTPTDLVPDGSYHKLRVELAGSGHHGEDVVHRSGYYAPRPFGELHPLEKSLLASDAIASAAPRDDVDMNVLAAPFRASDKLAYVPVIIEIDGKSLLAGDQEKKLATELYAYVSNDHGEMKDFFTQVVTLNITDQGRQSMLNGGLKYYGHMDLAPGKYLLRVLVRNASTGRTGVRSVRLTVPEYKQARPELLPPFFLERPGRWVLVREKSSQGRETVVYPFTINGNPYVPAAKPIVRPGEDSEICLVAYNLKRGDLELQGTVITEDGRELHNIADLELVERTVTGIGGLDKLLARFRVDDLRTGNYTLKVALRQPGGGVSQVNSIPFSVPN